MFVLLSPLLPYPLTVFLLARFPFLFSYQAVSIAVILPLRTHDCASAYPYLSVYVCFCCRKRIFPGRHTVATFLTYLAPFSWPHCTFQFSARSQILTHVTHELMWRQQIQQKQHLSKHSALLTHFASECVSVYTNKYSQRWSKPISVFRWVHRPTSRRAFPADYYFVHDLAEYGHRSKPPALWSFASEYRDIERGCI